MISVIAATNRPGSNTSKLANKYVELLEKQNIKAEYFSLEQLPPDFIFSENYGKRSPAFEDLVKKMLGNERLVIIIPEYNGSYPGVLKAFIDVINPKLFNFKKVAIVGIATGRAGNIRGMDDLTNVLHHLKAHVFYHKIPVSRFDELLDQEKALSHSATIDALEQQIQGFLQY
jgi:chromate reductase, NAD(P)H dehydrogenase (quinone)